MPVHLAHRGIGGQHLLIQFCRNGDRIVDERLASDGVEAIRHVVLMVATLDELKAGDLIKVKSA
jgi:hypothetical protein